MQNQRLGKQYAIIDWTDRISNWITTKCKLISFKPIACHYAKESNISAESIQPYSRIMNHRNVTVVPTHTQPLTPSVVVQLCESLSMWRDDAWQMSADWLVCAAPILQSARQQPIITLVTIQPKRQYENECCTPRELSRTFYNSQ